MAKVKDSELIAYMGRQIRAFRIDMGINQEGLAELSQLTRASIVNIEGGRQRMTVDLIHFFCSLFNCSPNDLFPPVVPIKIIQSEEEVEIMVPKKVKKVHYSIEIKPGREAGKK